MDPRVPREALALLVPARHPGDAAAVAALFDRGAIRPEEVVAILGKTEGNGCVNDFTRAYAVEALAHMLARRLRCGPEEVLARVAMVMSGGTEGGLSPHFLVLGVRETGEPPAGRALAIGTAFTREFRPEELGRRAQIEATAEAVREAMAQAGISDARDVHYAQVKCPLLTADRMAEARGRGEAVATEDSYASMGASMGLSRGASALGVALALGEIAEAPADAAIGADWSLFSAVASCSAGVELVRNEVVLLGTSAEWAGPLTVAHDVMADAIDLPAVQRALASAGLGEAAGQLADPSRLVALLCKAEPSSTGLIRGRRHTMLDDSDINATRHARALVGGVVAAATGRTDLFVSGGAEHQGPDGGGPVAVIARRRA